MDEQQWKKEVSQCVKCGSCLSVCPVYRETGREPLAARGKLSLLADYLSGLLPGDQELYHLLSNCLLCGACAENCPGGVAADELIQKGRSLFLEKTGAAPWKKFLAGQLLPHPKRIQKLSKGQGLLFKKIPEERGIRLRFFKDSRIWPELADPFFLDWKAPAAPRPRTPSRRIGYFVGCMTNYLYPEIGQAASTLLAPLGEVVIPQSQTCCGLPAFALGDIKTARELARQNILAFKEEKVEAVVVSCSSCAAHLKLTYPQLLAGETTIRDEATDFTRKVRELSQFLVSSKKGFDCERKAADPGQEKVLRILFHDPCHAKRKLHLAGEPRMLLASRPGLALVEPEVQQCCGHGGLFHLSHPDLSQKILERPSGAFDQPGIDVITTSCLACLMQFKEGVLRSGKKVLVKHWAELMTKKAGARAKK